MEIQNNIARLKQKEKSLLKKAGLAIHDYCMIKKDDRICVAVSGGKDSLTLLKLLSLRTLKISLGYSLIAVHIETDFKCKGCIHKETIKKIFDEWGIAGIFSKISVLNSKSKKGITCFWCSWNRRKAIFEIAGKFNCNKIALGHHKDDVIETMLLNLLFNGEISTMNPKQAIFNGRFEIIRPLCYAEKKEITAYALTAGFPDCFCSCPNAFISKRKFVKDFIDEAAKLSPGIKTNIFRAPSRIRHEYLGKTLIPRRNHRAFPPKVDPPLAEACGMAAKIFL